jgi:alpha-1,2-mannosyltransferase
MNQPAQLGTWLTPRRLRGHALMLGISLWSIYIWSLATPGLRDRNGNFKGTDFLHFYTLAWVAREHRQADLYNVDAQTAVATQHVPEAAGIRYLPLYPPQVSILVEPLSYLSYPWALACWWIASAAIYAVCCYGVWRVCFNLHGHGWIVFLIATAFPAFFHLIVWGQTSAVALACFTLMFFCLGTKREFLAGVVFGCLIFKPQLALAAAVVFLLSGAWKIVGGAIASAIAQLSVGIFYYGLGPLRAWLHVLNSVQSVMPWFEPRIYQTHCLRTFWSMLIPWPGLALLLYIASALLVLAITVVIWKRVIPLSLRYSALLLATVLVAPHLTVYDLVILAPVVLLLADSLVARQPDRSNWQIGTSLYFVYLLPLVGPLARWTHVQLSVLAMTMLVYLVWRVDRDNADGRLRVERSQTVQIA